MASSIDLTGQVALVTGASRGIGKAIATALADAGAFVFGSATSDTGATAISDYLGENGKGVVLNVASQENVDQIISNIADEKGAVTILVNNAGITDDTLLMRMKESQWQSVIDTNLSSVYRTSKACLRGMMKAKHGRVINISSVVGLMGNAGQINYAASKAGIVGFSKSMALEVGSRGITVNTIAPGYIQTDMTAELSDEQLQAMIANQALPSVGAPEDIANTVLFLASDMGKHITGETINVSGGLYM